MGSHMWHRNVIGSIYWEQYTWHYLDGVHSGLGSDHPKIAPSSLSLSTGKPYTRIDLISQKASAKAAGFEFTKSVPT